jgi:hypothetical protein
MSYFVSSYGERKILLAGWWLVLATSHQPASSIFLSQQISTSHQLCLI